MDALLPFNMRRSTNRRSGDVSTIVDVGSLAVPGSHRIDLRIDMLPMMYVEPRVAFTKQTKLCASWKS